MQAKHAHAHHQAAPDADTRWLAGAAALIVAFMAGEIVAGVAAHSLALLSDAAHMITDAAAIGLAIVTARVAGRPARGGYTYGLRRLEILSAQANGITLVLLAAWLAFEAVRRLITPHQVAGPLMLGVALAGVCVNLVASWLLAKANGASGRRSLNMEGAVAHVLTDLYAFAATVAAAIIVLATGFARADAIATLVVVGLMLRAGSGLIRESGRIFLEAAPANLDPAALGREMAAMPHVAEVHDLHIWEITTGMTAASAHVLVEPREDCHAVRAGLEALLARQHGITHLTLQVDHVPDRDVSATASRQDQAAQEHGKAGLPVQARPRADDRQPAGDQPDDHQPDHHQAGVHQAGEHAAGHDDHELSPQHCEDSHGPAYRPNAP